jgi:hypothetical protein
VSGPGWDACTGLGRADGSALLTALKQQGTELGDVLNISAAAWSANRLDILVKGTDDAMWHKYWGVTGWGGFEPLGGIITSQPNVVSWGPNRLDIFIKGTDNALWNKWWDGSTWGGWVSLGGILTSAPQAVSWGPNHLDVFIRGNDGAWWHRLGNGIAWGAWESLGGVLVGQPNPVSWGPNRIDIFALGLDRAMYHKWWDGSAWGGWEPRGGLLTRCLAQSIGRQVVSISSEKVRMMRCITAGGTAITGADGRIWAEYSPRNEDSETETVQISGQSKLGHSWLDQTQFARNLSGPPTWRNLPTLAK